MAWIVSSPHMQRCDLVRDYLEGHSVASLARKYSVSEKTAWKWIARWNHEPHPDSLRDRSRAPQHIPNRLDEELAQLILQARCDHPTWGPRKLIAYLKRRHPNQASWPSSSTAGELLKRHGLVVARRPRARALPSSVLQPPRGVNHIWGMDYKGYWRLGDGTECGPLTITDLESRYLVRALALEENTELHTRSALTGAFREFGLPQRLRSDNGPPFASTGPFGLSRLGVWLIQLGIEHERITPGRPQQNGSHERMHLTMQLEVASKPASTRQEQQRLLESFRQEFNEVRPHEALGQIPPGEIYSPSEREFPEHLARPEYDKQREVRVVDHGGLLRFKGKRVFVGRVLGSMSVGITPCEQKDGRWELWFYDRLLGWIDERTLRVESAPWGERESAPPGPPAVEMPS